MKRNLDGVYFRVLGENNRYDNVCFSDLTEEQRYEVMKDQSTEWLKTLCNILGECIKDIGDQFNIVGGGEHYE